jgi:hypothetical protein
MFLKTYIHNRSNITGTLHHEKMFLKTYEKMFLKTYEKMFLKTQIDMNIDATQIDANLDTTKIDVQCEYCRDANRPDAKQSNIRKY